MAITPIRKQIACAVATEETLYDVPLATTARVTILVCNRTSVPSFFNVANRALGVALANEHYIAYNDTIGGNETKVIVNDLQLLAEDLIEVYSTSGEITFQLYGEETT
jgi:hypothetical protein